jgi:zinc protease
MDEQGLPTGRLESLLWSTAFDDHPYNHVVEGTPDTIAALNASDLKAFHNAFYAPGNVSLLAVGDVAPAAFLELARGCLAPYPGRSVTLPEVTADAPLASPRTRLERAATRATVLAYAWRTPGIGRKRDVCAMDLIYALLGEGEDARLVHSLLTGDQVQGVPDVQFITRRDPGLFTIICLCQPEKEFAIRDLVLAEVQALRDEPVSAPDLDQARQALRVSYLMDNQGVSGEVGSMAFYQAIDTYQFASDYLAEVDRVTPQDIQRVAAAYLGATNYVLAIIRPRGDTGDTTLEAKLTP